MTATITDEAVLADLDFEHEQPCELGHRLHGGDPTARLLIADGCGICGGGQTVEVFVCPTGWAWLDRLKFRCPDCGAHRIPRDLAWRVVRTTIGGP